MFCKIFAFTIEILKIICYNILVKYNLYIFSFWSIEMFGLLNVFSGETIDGIKSFFVFAKESFLKFQINDAIDILLLTFLFFFAARFFKSRKAGALLIGIVVCLVIYFVASIFDLQGVTFILSGIFRIDIATLVFVIIFQPELRDVLERVGAGSINGFRSFGSDSKDKQRQYHIISNIAKAVHVLSVEKTGALIVIERTTQLDDVLHSGTVINADVSDSLLRNLFYNRAPLHDGAVIISDDKISAAACILPLPRRTFVEGDLGTRHRAAIGLSEVSDALIIVVSEETGIISVAKECELIRDFTSDSLRKFLVRELLREEHVEDN